MCGIVGFSRVPTQSSINDTRRLLIAGLVAVEERGRDSVGVGWTTGTQQKVWHHKLVGPATQVAKDLDLGGRAPLHNAIGHTRWASQGAVNKVNAHPVVAHNIVLIHNGTIHNDDELIDMAGMNRVGTVDSWAMAALLAARKRIGAEHPAELLELVEGSAAIAWLDANDPHALHLARIHGSPLHLGWTRKGDLVFSSTRQTLARAGRLAKLEISEVTEVKEGTYLRIEQGAVKEWRTFTPATRSWASRFSPHPTPSGRATAAVPQQRGYLHGITDLFEDGRRPSDWWDEAEKLLGSSLDGSDDDPADRWPTGEELLQARPKNQWDW